MKKIIVALFVALFMSACSSPTWDNMSEDTIAAWKAQGVDVETANYLTDKNVTPAAYGEYKAAGISDAELVVDWSAAKFKGADAKAWMDGGFELDDAVENRAKGLSPVKAKTEDKEPAKETKAEEPAKETKAEEPAE